jgi:MYXO-CTERM domain-containing protein
MRLWALCVLLAAPLASAETYFGRNPQNSGRLTLVGITNGTTWEVRTLPGNALVQQGTLARLSRVDLALNTTREFKLVTSRPVLAVLGADCCNYSGSFFYPQEDGRKFWGTRFVFTPMANGANQQFVYTRDPAVVRVLDGSGTQIAVSPTLAAGQRWQIPGVVTGSTYSVESSAPPATTSAALIAVQANSGNGNTAVPPVPTAANQLLEDCNNDRGVDFVFSTYAWARGSLAVFNAGSSAITFSLQTVTGAAATPTAGYQNISVPARTAFLNTAANGFASLGTAQYRLTATGPVTVWAGDLEGGTGIADMGDDLTANFGENGRNFLVHSQTQGATVFALEANTQVTWSSGGAPTVTTLNADGFLALPANALYTITSTRPVMVQTVGGNGLNDWAVQLRPAQRLDTDGNGIADSLEGGSCTSVAPDTDGDGLFNFEDPDDDNDCLPDATDSSRLVATVPNTNASANCAAPTPVCDTSFGVCRGCLSSADCTGGRACNPTTFTCQVPPSTVITARPSNPSNANSGTFSFNSPGNPTATFQCSLDGAPFTSCTSPLTTGVLSEGSHTFVVRAVLGPLVDPVGATVIWLIDVTQPAAPTLTAPPNGARLAVAQPVVTGTAEPGSTVTIFIDGIAVGTAVASSGGTFTFTSPALADGTHVVSATARDAAGNTGPSSAINIFVVDRTPPPAPLVLTPANGGTVGNATPTITGTSEPGSTVSVRVDGMVLGTALADATGAWTFTSPIALGAGAHTVSARATDAVGNTGAESPASTFTVDLTLLDTSIASGPAALTNSASATFVFSANKPGASFECDLDGLGFSGCGNPSTFTALGEGPHSLRVRAVRGAEVDPTPATQTWSVDTVAPLAPTIDAPTANEALSTARPVVSGVAGAGELVTIFVDGVAVGTVTANALGGFSFTLPTNLADGAHTVRATAQDLAGNVSPQSLARPFTIDTTAPFPPTVTSPTNGSTVANASPTFSGIAEAGSTVAVEIDGLIVGTAVANSSGQWTLLSPSPLADGPHTVRARATDAVGNQSTAGPTVSFSVDTTAPATPTLVTPAAGSSSSSDRPLVQGSADPGSVVTIRIDGVVVGTTVAASNGAFSFTPAALADGPHSITVQATDALGNTSAASTPRTFAVDTAAPPAPVVTEPAAGSTIGLVSPVVRGTAEANAVVTVIIDSVAVGTAVADASGAWAFTTAPLSQGQHSVSGTARDAAGNTSPAAAQVVFTIDTTVLDTSILSGPRSPTNASSASFSFSSNKAPVTFECRVDTGAFAACANPAVITGLADGSHRLEARARYTPTAELDTTPASFTWVLDTQAPVAPNVQSPAQGAALASAQVTVSGQAEPGSTVNVIVDSGLVGSAVAAADGSWTLLLPSALTDGVHTVSAQATDLAGNTGPQSVIHTFTVDTQAPVAPSVTTPAAGALLATGTPTYAGTAEPGSTVTVTVDGLVLGTTTANGAGLWSFTPTTALVDGAHTVSATARDAAGNQSPSSMPVSFETVTSVPGAPTIQAPATDSVLADSTPTVRGEAEPGATVAIFVDGVAVGLTVADRNGAWSFTSPVPLADGAHTVTATATDAAGNASPASPATPFTVDTVAPASPDILSPGMGAVIGDATPSISGTAEPGATVRVAVDGVIIGTAVADMNGKWSVPVPPGQVLGEGPHEVRADATDAAGNSSAESTSSFTVQFPAVDAGVDAGLISDAGVDGGLDGGSSEIDAGAFDAGLADAGEVEDGGVDNLIPENGLRGGGCGCRATDGSTLFGLLALVALRLRRRRA